MRAATRDIPRDDRDLTQSARGQVVLTLLPDAANSSSVLKNSFFNTLWSGTATCRHFSAAANG